MTTTSAKTKDRITKPTPSSTSFTCSKPPVTSDSQPSGDAKSTPQASTPLVGFKATLHPYTLAEKLALVMKAIPKKNPSHPIFLNLLIEADKKTQTLKLTAFDLRTCITTRCPATVEQAGTWTVSAKLLESMVKTLSEEPITLAVNPTSQQVELISNLSIYHLPGRSPSDYPALPLLPAVSPLTLPASAFISSLSVLIAASKDEKKPILNGANFRIEEKLFSIAATDGHRLAAYSHKLTSPVLPQSSQSSKTSNTKSEKAFQPIQLTIPTKDLRDLEQIIDSEAVESVSLYYDSSQQKGSGSVVALEIGNGKTTVIARLLDGTYPNWPDLLPRTFERTVTLNRHAFFNAMERISILAEQSQDPEKTVEVDIDVAHKEMRLKVDTPTAGSGREAVGIERIKGDDISIAFNAKFLLDGLKAIASEQVQLRINSNSTPVVLESVGNLRLRYLIMPVLVSQPQN